MFRCLHIILRVSAIMYDKGTELIKWKHLYRRLLQKIKRIRHLTRRKICQFVYNS